MDLLTGSHNPDTMRDVRAFDQCFMCGLAMCEECDYMEDVDLEPDGQSPHPDPTTITLCNDCLMWWNMGDIFEDEDW